MRISIAVMVLCLVVGCQPASPVSIETAAPIKTVTIDQNRAFVVNGRPFFPIMSWAQPTKNFDKLRSVGINTFCGDPGAAQDYCAAAQAADRYVITHFDKTVAGHPYLLGWIHGDEPDMPGKKQDTETAASKSDNVPRRSAEQLADHFQRIKRADTSRPAFMTFTSHFMKEFTNKYDQAAKDRIYPEFVKHCDVIGFDTYPVYGWNRPDWLDYPGRGVTQLRAIAGPQKPVYAWIETHKGSRWITYEKQLDVLPKHTRSEVWLAVIRGATAIGYFTHAWRPQFTEFAPTDQMQQELKRINNQITRLAPVILSAPAKTEVSISITGDVKADIMARRFKKRLYLFAVNYDPAERSGTATVNIPNLKAGTKIEVVDEDRSLTAQKGAFTDHFDPLAVHIYKLKL